MTYRYSIEPKVKERTVSITPLGKFALVLVSLMLMSIGISLDKKRAQPFLSHTVKDISGFAITDMDDGVTKMVNDAILIYVKPIPEFFSGEHTPLICWKGSGYTFKNVGKSEVGGKEIYYGQLVKKNETLYTAWWYDNGTVQT